MRKCYLSISLRPGLGDGLALFAGPSFASLMAVNAWLIPDKVRPSLGNKWKSRPSCINFCDCLTLSLFDSRNGSHSPWGNSFFNSARLRPARAEYSNAIWNCPLNCFRSSDTLFLRRSMFVTSFATLLFVVWIKRTVGSYLAHGSRLTHVSWVTNFSQGCICHDHIMLLGWRRFLKAHNILRYDVKRLLINAINGSCWMEPRVIV